MHTYLNALITTIQFWGIICIISHIYTELVLWYQHLGCQENKQIFVLRSWLLQTKKGFQGFTVRVKPGLAKIDAWNQKVVASDMTCNNWYVRSSLKYKNKIPLTKLEQQCVLFYTYWFVNWLEGWVTQLNKKALIDLRVCLSECLRLISQLFRLHRWLEGVFF